MLQKVAKDNNRTERRVEAGSVANPEGMEASSGVGPQRSAEEALRVVLYQATES